MTAAGPEPTVDRVRRFRTQLALPRRVETNPVNDRPPTAGFLAETDRVRPEVRECRSRLPAAPAPAG
ncbi:MAG: hypothetical protein C0501_08180 [Isosphaera sp.]|nr:hypothetical protein [Isosphaera sp.]